MKILHEHRILCKLAVAVPNPKPDKRRKRDWTSKTEFEPGLYLLKEEKVSISVGDKEVEGINCTVYKITTPQGDISSAYFAEYLEEDKEQYETLTANLEKINPNFRNLQHVVALHRDMESYHLHEVLQWLLQMGVVSGEQLVIAMDEVVKQWHSED